MKSKIISISAIAASLVALCLIIGVYIEIAELMAVVFASCFVILPLYYKSFKGCILCYIAGGILGLICGAFNIISIVFPAYFCYFGIYPIIIFLFINKKVKSVFRIIVGIVWCVAFFYGAFFYYSFVLKITFDNLPLFIKDNIMWLIAPFGVFFFFIYDRFIIVLKRFYDRFLPKIIK